MKRPSDSCPVCNGDSFDLDRRHFLKVAGAAAGAAVLPMTARAADEKPTPETLVKKLYESLSDSQKKDVSFDWDHQHPQWGLLRTRISNNWHITTQQIKSDYYTKDQQE